MICNRSGIHAGRRLAGRGRVRTALSIARRQADGATNDRLLARCLRNRAVVLKHAGLSADASDTTEQAIAVRRRLVEAEPAIYETDLAASLTLAASMQYVLNRNEDAAARWTEAAEIYRRHVDDLAHREHLANALHDLALAQRRSPAPRSYQRDE